MPLRKPSNSMVAKASTTLLVYSNNAQKSVNGTPNLQTMRSVQVAIPGAYRISYVANHFQGESQVYVNGVATGPLRTSNSGDINYLVDTILPANAIVEIKFRPYGGYGNYINGFAFYADIPTFTTIV